MKKIIFKNPDDAAGQRHIFGETFFKCHDCRTVLPCPPEKDSLVTGYARCDDGKSLVCYSCCDKRQVEELRDRSKPFHAYLSGDGLTVGTWTGGKLMDVVSRWSCKLSRRSWAHGKDYSSVRARDVHGALWYGRGSPGVCITMRPRKG